MLRLAAARTLAIDRLTAEVATALAGVGVEALVLKGPVLADWLYPGELRTYGDSDLMVARGDWERAVDLLHELGFLPEPSVLRPLDAMRELSLRGQSSFKGALYALAHPKLESLAGTGFMRGAQNVDLHCTLYGLDADPTAVWPAFAAGAPVQSIGGAELCVPSRAALLLHICLHAAHHHEGKALEDLRRAIARTHEKGWREALELATRLDGLRAFASGLSLLPEGALIAEGLGVGDVRSAEYELRFQRIATAEAINTLLSRGTGTRARILMLASKLFPRPEFMRWWSPLARRGRVGLLASYPYRWWWLLSNAPRALLAVFNARRRER